MRFLFVISSAFLLFLTPAPAEAQLLVDSKAKLKTSKAKEERRFLFFKKKASKRTPRKKKVAIAPRYSQQTVVGSKKQITPRYSRESIRHVSKKTKISPKYLTVSGGAAQVSRKSISPRYSQPVSFRKTSFVGASRYYKPVSWEKSHFSRIPRYSKPVRWKNTNYGRMVRHSQPVNWKDAYISRTPKYSSFKHRFVVHKRYQKKTRPYTPWIGLYSGFVKYKKPNHKNMHPSVNHLTAKNISSKGIKKGLRKWDNFWIRMNPKRINPPGMRKGAKKLKFDKREKNIWNNGRDKKPTTRNYSVAGSVESSNLEAESKNKP